MLEAIFGSAAAERTLLFMQNYDEGYGMEIAEAFDMPVNEVQKQLRKFEEGGLLVSRQVGRTRLYTWNPRSPLVPALRALLGEAIKVLPDADLKRYYRKRRRPRRAGKPL